MKAGLFALVALLCALAPGQALAPLTELALEIFLKDKVSAFKIPRKILFVSELPVGLTGKVQHFRS